ncbi:SRPBCC domain-containing protein [Jatrophihabitans sp. DSM 45814]
MTDSVNLPEPKRIAPVRQQVWASADLDRTFALFTERMTAWWPLAEHSVFGDGTVAFEDGRLIERSGDRSSVWAEVIEWDAPHLLRLAWHPGSEATRSTEVRVSFTPDGERTLVQIEHRGWEVLAEPATAADEYRNGWPAVLAALATEAGGEQPAAEEWYALLHRPGPALAPGQSVFAAEAFSEHVAFLNRLHGLGMLVAAGPLPDEDGAGMTIVRVRPEHGDVDVTAMARTDDQCVAGGFLEVTVRPWRVMFTA